jgi:hypothetical protein
LPPLKQPVTTTFIVRTNHHREAQATTTTTNNITTTTVTTNYNNNITTTTTDNNNIRINIIMSYDTNSSSSVGYNSCPIFNTASRTPICLSVL